MIETLEDLIATATQPRKPKLGVPHNKIIAGLHRLIDEMASDIMASDGNIKVELFVNDLSIDARLTRFIAKCSVVLKDVPPTA